jgi:hypothetical protein
METAARDLLVTGLPRAGTTLLVHLLDKLPDVVALDEPMDAKSFMAGKSADAMVGDVAEFVRTQRKSIVERRAAITYHSGGKVPDNSVGTARDAAGKRRKEATKGEVAITKELSPQFVLVMKHNAAFTALLEPLSKRFTTFAAVRNPLAVLASWNSVSLPVGRGHVPTAEAIDPKLRADLAAMDDVVRRQIRILDWFCARFADGVPAGRVIRYEDVVATRGRALAALVPSAASLDEELESRNRNALYDTSAIAEIGRRLLDTDGAFWRFYSRESVADLLP